MNDTLGRGIKTTDTVFDIVERLNSLGGATVTELAEVLGLAPSTVHDHLASLVRRGYVVKDDGEYRTSLLFLGLGMAARERYALIGPGERAVSKLAEKTSQRAQLLLEENGRAIVVCRSTDAGTSSGDVLGRVLPMHCTAGGKAILAFYPEGRVDEILDRHGLPGLTDNTITEREALYEELASIRERGFAINEGESVRGIRSVGCPVVVDGRAIASVTVTGSEHIMDGDYLTGELSKRVLEATNEIEMAITDIGGSNVV
jgi:DNA-binding IclR family transcriptional regulator